MRTVLLLGSAAGLLAACGGGAGAGPESAGSVSAVTGSGDIYGEFVKPTAARTYVGVGGNQHYSYTTDDRNCCDQQAQLYGGSSSTVRGSTIAVTYDPRDATFTLKIADEGASGASVSTRFQDPANRTNFGGSVQPQWGTPNLLDTAAAKQYANPNIQYLQAGDGDPLSPYRASGTGAISYGTPDTPPNGTDGSSYQSTTFFYEKPGSSTKYVTLGGYLANRLSFNKIQVGGADVFQDSWKLDRGAFAFGIFTDNSAVPITGTASYSGNMLGTMVYNPTMDDPNPSPTFFQWLTGTSKVTVDFGAKSVQLALAGVVLAPSIDRFTTPQTAYITAGSTFAGNGSATIDLVQKGGFTGSFQGGSWTFAAPTGATFADGKSSVAVNVVGSSIDGAFYGPKADEVGGGFRVVGGVPDQRVDILGAFTGKK